MEEKKSEFEQEQEMGIVQEFLAFLMENKLWWMIPIFCVLALLMGIIITASNAGAATPFIYTLF